MKVSLDWLNEYVDLPTQDPDELAHVFNMVGHAVESVETVRPAWSGVRVASVETVEPHPDADKVRVCTVTTGGEPVTVVCGAWNFEAGATVAFAEPGAVLGDDFEIGVRAIRGVESHGMICSERELGLGDDHEGILVLDGAATVGEPLEHVLDLPDVVFELEITPNRPDAMSMVGIARDLAGWFGTRLRSPAPEPPTVPGGTGIDITIEDPHGNPRFTARRVDGVDTGPSPLWMRERLRRAGIRPISNLVDVTNYVMIELGHPLHVFDADKIAGGSLVIRRAREGEHLVTLDGVDRRLTPDDLVIADADGPTSLAGTMGGEASEVSETTTSTLIEAATWDPPTVMFMSRRHGLRSEASARFERGVDPALPPLATLRAAELVLQTGGGDLAEEATDEIARVIEPATLDLPLRDVTRLLGDRFDRETVVELLQRIGFEVSGNDPLHVTVPTFRPDVTRPVDLVEEVARLADYDSFDSRVRLGTGGGLEPDQRLMRRVRAWLADNGFSQAVSLTFVTPEEIDAFDPPPDHELRATVSIKNPLSREESILRPSLLPGLLRVLRHNRARGRADVAVFESGRVFHHIPWPTDRRVPDQPNRLGIAAIGSAGDRDLTGRGRPADVHTMTALIRAMSSAMALDLTLEQGTAPGMHPTRTAVVSASGTPIGLAGELHPITAHAFELDERVAVAELDLDRLVEARLDPAYRPVSPYPPVDFDLSFEVDEATAAAELEHIVAAAGGDLVEWTMVFDEFRGGSLPAERKALAIRVRLRAPDRTLTAEEIGAVRSTMVGAAADSGAALRGGG